MLGLLACAVVSHAETRTVQSLDANWKFHLVPDSAKPTPNAVPSWQWRPLSNGVNADLSSIDQVLKSEPMTEWKTAHATDDVFHGRVGYALFETTITAPPKMNVLHFDSVDDNGTVFLNGKRILHHDGWNDPFDVSLAGLPSGKPITVDVIDENGDGPGGIGSVSFARSDLSTSFKEASASFTDASWRTVHVPHDFVLEGKFNEAVDSNHASLPRGKAWYRRAIDLPTSAKGKAIWVDFEGAFADAHVWWNGHFLGSHRSGYTGFRFDLSQYAQVGGHNELAVLLDATKTEGWWYEGGGIYRHVWLTIANPVHVAPLGGVFITTTVPNPLAAKPRAVVSVQTSIDGAPWKGARLLQTLISPSGTVIASELRPLWRGPHLVRMSLVEPLAKLWSVEHPVLYSLRTEIFVGFRKVDEVTTPFGIRTIRFDKDRGFLLNERPVKLKGTCNHQDFAGVGIAMPDNVLEWRVKRLQSFGSNAYRCSHNEVAPELLDICDRLGMLVMDENREFGDTWSGKANEHTTTKDLSDLRQEILRDRNHPSVIMWSLCNEEFAVQTTPAGGRLATVLGKVVRELDPTRPFTAALNGGHGHTMSAALDLEGFNYGPWEYPAYHKAHPNQPIFSSEPASTVTTRGEYADDKARGMVQAYDVDGSNTAEDAWEPIAEEPYNAGAFVWTGFDYKGEPSPYSWPNISSNFGILDTCGFYKDNAYYYKAWWGSTPTVHIEPHWNWAGMEGKPIKVWVFGNGDQVEMFVNGHSIGSKPMPKYRHLEWTIPYSPGTLEAKSLINGRIVARDVVSTTGPAYGLQVTTTNAHIRANSEDCAMLEVSIVDKFGSVIPDATNLIHFASTGAAQILGVGNGDPTSHEPDRATQRHAFHGLCLGIAQAGDKPGQATVTVSSPGLKSATIRLGVGKA